jgi:hypothetical protein
LWPRVLVFICLLEALSGATYAAAQCSTMSFKGAGHVNTGLHPSALVTDDFNGDGRRDLAVANNLSSNVSVLLGDGTDKFAAATNYPVGGGPYTLAAGDFNGDGKVDLVTANVTASFNSDNVSVLLGTGAGTFGAASNHAIGQRVNVLAAGDFNGDGLSDIALGSADAGNRVMIWLSNGAGGFNDAAPIVTLGPTYTIVVGKFNGDNILDLALDLNNQTAVFTGNGSGGFNAANPLPAGFGAQATGDFNGDGKADLVGAKNFDEGISIMHGDGAGNFSAPSIFPDDGSGGITVGDFNGDGKSDIAALDGDGANVSILHGDGAGQLGTATLYSVGYVPNSIVSADFNADGKPDLAVTSIDGVTMLYGTAGGEFAGTLNFKAGYRPGDLVRADFNRDGNDDLAVVNSRELVSDQLVAARVLIFLGDGAGHLSNAPAVQFQGDIFLGTIITADFNNDGKADLAVANGSETTDGVSVMMGNGDGTFASPSNNVLNAYGRTISDLDTADINRDGLVDIVVRLNAPGRFVTLLGAGTGNFTISPVSNGPAASFFEEFSIADFNQDANPDLVFVSYYGQSLTILLGNGAGQFNTQLVHPLPNNQRAVIAQDFNRDGKTDVAFISNSSSISADYVSIRLGDGAGNFGDATDYAVGSNALSLIAADFNGDTLIDLAVTSNNSSGNVSLLLGDGAGAFNLSLPLRVWGHPGASVSGDFNRDGKTDLAVSRSVAILLNDSVALLPCLSIDDVAITEDDEGQSNATFNITLSEASAQAVSVSFRVEPRPVFVAEEMKSYVPEAGADYFPPSGTVVFAPGTTTQTINVPVYGDRSDEYDEAFSVLLASPINAAIRDPHGIGTILDNDAPPTVRIEDFSVIEGDAAANPQRVNLHLSLSAPSAKSIVFPYQTAPGTATASSDYQHATGSVNFIPGRVGHDINLTIIDDAIDETDETFFVNLGGSPNANVIDTQAQVTIIDDDPQVNNEPQLAISFIPPAFMNEGNSGITNVRARVVLSEASTQTITVNYSTLDGTANAGSDYVAASGSLTFSPGELSKILDVSINGDTIDEVDENFKLTLSGATNATIGTSSAVFTIFDDDGPTVSINDVSVVEGDGGWKEVFFTVSLSAPTVQDVTVRYDFSPFHSTANSDDYRRIPLEVRATILHGQLSTQFFVRVNGDIEVEPDEALVISLYNPVGATIADGLGTCTIINDDNAGTLQFSAPSYSVNESAPFGTFNINRVGGSSGTVSVSFITGSGTATPGSDYQETGYVVTFLHGETTKSGLSLPIKDDALVEGAETVNLILRNPSNGAVLGSPATALMTIQDDDSNCVDSLSPSSRTSPPAGETLTVNVTAQGGCNWSAFTNSNFISVTSGASGAGNGVVALNVLSNGSGVPRTGTVVIGGQTLTITQPEVLPQPPTLQFGATSYAVDENAGRVTVAVTLTGGSVGGVSVNYRTVDTDAFTVSCANNANNNGGAFARCDFATSVGRLDFGVGETQKLISIPIINDGHDEESETFQIHLSNASGVAVLGTPSATSVVIQDDDSAGTANPIFTTPFFVRQHYLDFLSREPEANEPWSPILNNCANAFNLDPASPSARCDRLIVSQSFFGSPEFNTKGFYVFRFYKLAFDRLPEYTEIVSDMSFVAGATEAEVYARKAQLANAFVARQEFLDTYGNLSNAGYVEALLRRYGLTRITAPDPQQPDGVTKVILTQGELISRLNADGLTRGQVLRAVADSDEVGAREFENAFVAAQYYGYLRRKPEPDGYAAWLAVLRRGDIRTMVNGFMNSAEYKLRFGRL